MFSSSLLLVFLSMGLALLFFYSWRNSLLGARQLQVRLHQTEIELALAKTAAERQVLLKQELEEKEAANLLLREQLVACEKDIDAFQKLQEQKNALQEEKLAFLQEAKEKLSENFKALTHDIFQKQQESFLLSAKESFSQLRQSSSLELEEKKKAIKEVVGDLKGSLKEVNEKVETLEKGRVKAYASLENHLELLYGSHRDLKKETQQLLSTLKAPQARGCWGEVQLKRLLELSGMLNYCDFVEQGQASKEDAKLRPDILVTLPNQRHIVIDAKVPMQAFIDSLDEEDEQRKQQSLQKHVKMLKRHLQQLSSKDYWESFSGSPEFVVMFLPGEMLWVAALQQDPSLVQWSLEKKVVIATPTTLMALLHSIAYGWRQNSLTEHAKEVAQLGKELYKRLGKMTQHFQEMKKGLDKAVQAYNQGVGSFESRVMSSARKFEALGAGEPQALETPGPLEISTKSPNPL